VVPYVEDPWVDVNVFGYSSSPPPAGTTYVPVTSPGNPFSSAFLDQNQSQPESQPGYGDGAGYEILARARFVQYPRRYQNDENLYRVVGGLRGDITDDYHWDISANINRIALDYTNPGLLDTNALNAALADGQLNPFAVSQSATAFNGVVGTAFVNQLSTLNQFDAKFNGTPFTLPGGKVGFAVGFEYVLETLSAEPDINSLPNSTGTTQGWSNATTFQNFDAKRDFDSFYGELSIPITGPTQGIPALYSTNIDGALRYDSYSGQVGNSTTPEVRVSWSPFDSDLKFRASAGKSFIAPQLFSLYGPVSSGSTEQLTYNPVGGGAPKSAQFNQTGGSNPGLKPTTANSWTAGFVYTPKYVSGLHVNIDYSDITEHGVVGVAPVATIVQSVETLGPASPYAADVHYNTPTGPEVSAPGGISSRSPQQIYVIQNLVNLAGARVDSTDIDVEYVMPTSFGRWDFDSKWTWYNRYLLQIIPSEPYYNYTGTASTEQTTVPKWRTYTTANWRMSGWDATVGLTWIDSVEDIGAAGDNESGFERVGSFAEWDLQVGYDFGHLNLNRWLNGFKISVGVNNAFNKMPPEALAAYSGTTNADVGTYNGPIGRLVYIDGSYKF
jgi:iron complex outermembrane receptor protein